MILNFPVKQTVWGLINNVGDLNKAIQKSGQPFGVDWSGPACNVVPTAPCDKTYYQYLGFGLHQGIDIPVSTGTEVYAVADGKVVELSDVTTRGIGVVIYHPDLKLKTLYWHLLSHKVALGDQVKKGDLIAISDNTGYSIGPHLHFEVKTTDEHGLSIKSVDPMPYFSDDKMTDAQLNKLYLLAFKRPVDDGGRTTWSGKDFDTVADGLLASSENKEYTKVFESVKSLENDVRSGHF